MIDLRKITPLGEGLKILIDCEYCLSHEWMAFASWYSINKFLPDAKVKINCKRGNLNYQIFNWPKKCNVNFSFHDKDEDGFFKINPEVMAVSAFDFDFLGPVDCKTEENYTFVSYSNNCGLFEFEKHKNICPFSQVIKLYSDNLSLNEYRILKIWDKANAAYINIA